MYGVNYILHYIDFPEIYLFVYVRWTANVYLCGSYVFFVLLFAICYIVKE